ncbi:hypothetical protein J1N35_005060 [Gossypium stocksii]|uniref:CCHC-type domain-containing protein n=1 Tax=Gossypium stocksii TaxID=47602 RepID=A0A9D3WEL4_9ROSI|nr:hypothetical protein J1N35_005060 [Gossypium stocksii]
MSKILIAGRIQRVKYESLPLVCFGCGRYGHNKGICTYRADNAKPPTMVEDPPPQEVFEMLQKIEEERFGLWMLVEWKQRRGTRLVAVKSTRDLVVGESKGSRFESLSAFSGDDSGRVNQDIIVEDVDQISKAQIEDDKRDGLKVGRKILKPSNSLSGPFSGLAKNPFDDGSRMKPIIIKENMRDFSFQATSPKLDGGKYLAVSFISSGETKMVDANTQREESPNLRLNMGVNTGQRSCEEMERLVGENSK